MQAVNGQAVQRRTTAAALKQQATAFLAEALPEGWISQPLLPLGSGPAAEGRATIRPLAAGGGAEADILIISPRGHCHFLFVKAPADRWWDGGPRSAPAETITDCEIEMSRRLRAAGHNARAIWSGRDLARALKSWGCPLCLNCSH
jgi:hypothetical protein